MHRPRAQGRRADDEHDRRRRRRRAAPVAARAVVAAAPARVARWRHGRQRRQRRATSKGGCAMSGRGVAARRSRSSACSSLGAVGSRAVDARADSWCNPAMPRAHANGIELEYESFGDAARAADAHDHGPRLADDRVARRALPPPRRARLPRDPLRQPRRRPLDQARRPATRSTTWPTTPPASSTRSPAARPRRRRVDGRLHRAAPRAAPPAARRQPVHHHVLDGRARRRPPRARHPALADAAAADGAQPPTSSTAWPSRAASPRPATRSTSRASAASSPPASTATTSRSAANASSPPSCSPPTAPRASASVRAPTLVLHGADDPHRPRLRRRSHRPRHPGRAAPRLPRHGPRPPRRAVAHVRRRHRHPRRFRFRRRTRHPNSTYGAMGMVARPGVVEAAHRAQRDVHSGRWRRTPRSGDCAVSRRRDGPPYPSRPLPAPATVAARRLPRRSRRLPPPRAAPRAR